MAQRRRDIRREDAGFSFEVTPEIDQRIRRRFPFKLTGAQERVISEIAADMRSPKAMNRMLQGDVGSGKTVVALYAMLVAVANRLPGRAHGADGNPGDAALRDDPALPGRQPRADRPARRRPQRARAKAGPGARRGGRGGPGRRHARARRRRRGVQEPRPRRRGRAAQVRRDPAGEAAPERAPPGRAGDDGDADPADARADRLRRPGPLDARRDAARPAAGEEQVVSAGETGRGLRVHPRSASPPASRRSWSTRSWRNPRRST